MKNLKQTVTPANNGNMNELFRHKFTVRILADYEAYNSIIKYFEDVSVRIRIYGDRKYYILDKEAEQIARTKKQYRTIELTSHVDRSVRDEIDYILDIKERSLEKQNDRN